jgi:cellulose synthase (UDP-forming)
MLPWTRVPVRLAVVFLFVLLNARYLWWRLDSTLVPLSATPESLWTWMFLISEVLAILLLTWHFIVLIKPSDRSPEADLAEASLRKQAETKGVDILIPTYNEPEDILRRTIEAACRLDYPDYNVWVLDDGDRAWLKELCAGLPVIYLVRTDRKGFKAGNLNHALTQASHPLVCVVDADFALAPNFLWRTVGLLEDSQLGIVQTPQIFSNPDAIQYNLYGENAWPEAQCMFTDVMQPSRDTWDNAFCYGTGFVIKRECLDLVGGFPEETITEDFHTSCMLMSLGFKTRFLNEPLSSGLATQDIGGFVTQRTRWCVGTLQCFVAEGGVLRAKELSVIDRLFLMDPVLYHLGTIWKFFVLIAPALYWWFGISPFQSDLGHLLVVFAPRMLLSLYGFYWLSDRKTIPLVSEMDRVVGIFSLVTGIFKFLINPFRQTFTITGKKMDSTQTQIHWGIMRPHLILIAVTIAGLVYRYSSFQSEMFFMQPNVGLMISLTVYVLWQLFIACLICVQRPIPNGLLETVKGVRQGSIRATIKVLVKRIFLWS